MSRPTMKMLGTIRLIEKNLGVKFDGETKQEAWAYINTYLWESKAKVKEQQKAQRKTQNKCARPTHTTPVPQRVEVTETAPPADTANAYLAELVADSMYANIPEGLYWARLGFNDCSIGREGTERMFQALACIALGEHMEDKNLLDKGNKMLQNIQREWEMEDREAQMEAYSYMS